MPVHAPSTAAHAGARAPRARAAPAKAIEGGPPTAGARRQALRGDPKVRALSEALEGLVAAPPVAPLAPGELPPGLVWVNDAQPGLSRERQGEDWIVRDADGRRVTDDDTLRRVKRLAIPPAWQDVWICPQPQGHLQATGRDARGRKQYRYHPDWVAGRGADKFARLRAFGQALPRIRARVRRDLAAAEAPRGPRRVTRELVLATLVRLLDTTFMRVGNEEYAQANGSYGLTTLRTRHARVERGAVRLRFIGKSGVRHDLRLDDRRVVAAVRRCRELPGQELFGWQDDDGLVHRVSSSDVNEYLAEAAGTRVTAKDFRTWHGSVMALELVAEACREGGTAEGAVPSAGTTRAAAKAIVDQVARRLGNTAAVCRKAYIHPHVLACGDSLADADLREALRGEAWMADRATRAGRQLRAAERRLLALLDQREREAARARRRAARVQ